MENFAKREYYLRASDFDMNSNILPSSVLSIFQDAAGYHAESMGIGFASLLEKDLLWMIVRTKYVIERAPVKYSAVKVKTWPLAPRGPIVRREYVMTDMEGNVLIRSSSDWTVVNCKTRTLESAKDVYPITEFLTETAIEDKLKKIKDTESFEICGNVTAAFCDIDSNGHVNNTKYADYIVNALKPSRSIKEFQIDFQKEVLLGEDISLLVGADENRTVIKGVDKNEEKKFAAQIVYG